MCLFTTKPTPTHRNSVLDPPPHYSNYSAHPPPGVVRLPRGSVSRTSMRRSSERFVERDSYDYGHARRSQPRAIGYVEEPARRSRSRSRVVEYVEEEPRPVRSRVVREREYGGYDERGVPVTRTSKSGFGGEEDRRRSVSRSRVVRY